ncbi:hypothetical protein SAMN04487914_13252 [Arthrobacter sp. ok909]|uniref:hypothetical protein n=1 Tax=Arthrobacter sp. ok909 TaxID=1761746 RepID=UPI000890FE63|nr:hypothetical protein [Arthrobacter sp. ok909]SDP74216.1 hypothetical protein SAMN04487914_13252 [Arthrobacter sp. ok909]
MKTILGVAGAAVLAIALVACGGASKNATACKLYEDGYNQLADSVRLNLGADIVKSDRNMLPSRIKDALDKAEGDVAVAIRESKELAPGLASGDSDAGTAFFMTTDTVAEKCKADGAPIELHPTH